MGFLITASLHASSASYSHFATLTPTHHPSHNLSLLQFSKRQLLRTLSLPVENVAQGNFKAEPQRKPVRLFQGFECLDLSLTSHPPHQPSEYSVSYARSGLCHHDRMLIEAPRKAQIGGRAVPVAPCFPRTRAICRYRSSVQGTVRSEAARTQFLLSFTVILFPLVEPCTSYC